MAASQRAPKQWSLTDNETITSFESWRQNLLYCLSLDDKFVPYLSASWSKKSAQSPHHGFTDDGSDLPEGQRRTKEQKNQTLELMLGQIANFCPGIARNPFIKDSKSLDDVWQKIRLHLGFQRTGAHFLDLANLTLELNERPEALYQRINAFYQDNLLTPQSAITHHGDKITVEEDMTPSLAGLGSIQFRNWNCSSIPIPIPELELELKLVELKMELELKSLELELELELKTGIEFFATATAALTTIFKF